MLVHQRVTFQVTGTLRVLSQGMESLGGVSLPSHIAIFTEMVHGTTFMGIKQKLYNFLIWTEETYITIKTVEPFGMGPPGMIAFI